MVLTSIEGFSRAGVSRWGHTLKNRKEKMGATKRQLEMVPYPDFWEMKEKAKKFQESLPPYSTEDMIREMKSRGQYRTTGWIL